jgi:hypothetical protein
MAAENDKIKYSDIVAPDGSITELIAQLEALQTKYGSFEKAIRQGAKSIADVMKSASGATEKGRLTIKEASNEAAILEDAYKSLKYALSENGRLTEYVKSQVREVNKFTLEEEQRVRQAASSYNRLNSELSKALKEYNSMSAEQRKSEASGLALAQTISELRQQIKDIHNETKLHVESLTKLQKAEKDLAYLQSEEGQRYLSIKQQIAELTKARKEQKQVLTELEKLQQRLAYLESEEGQQVIALRAQIAELSKARKDDKQALTEIEKLQQRLAYLESEEGQQAIALRARIAEVTAERKQQLSSSNQLSESELRLSKAEHELAFALSETGKRVAELKAQTRDANNATLEQKRIAELASGSYNKLQAELKEMMSLWKSLSAEERNSSFGTSVQSEIQRLQAELKTLDDQLKVHVAALTEVQKAEQKLAFLRSEEGQRLLSLRQQINEVIAASKGEKATKDELTRAQEKLNYVTSEYYREVQAVTRQVNEQARIAKLTEQVNNSAVGSYNQLAAQYELNKIKLNAMSQEERRAIDVGQKLENETKRIYQQMIFLQEATGNHRLSIGNYAKAWNGLGNAMNQIVREIPSMTMGINMFFLAISNNVPILIDEIQLVQRQNALLRAEGKPTQNIIKAITSSIFGWQTALIVLMTVMAMHGEKIVEWFKQLSLVEYKVKTVGELHRTLAEELEKTNGSYGQNIVSLKKLQDEWEKLTSDEEKEKWIKNIQSEWSKLGLAVTSVSDAENVIVENTDVVIEALKLRAKAVAAQKLAAEQYEKALTKQNQAENIRKHPEQELSMWDFIWGLAGNYSIEGGLEDINEILNNRIKNLENEAAAAEKDADAYFNLAAAFEEQADAKLKNAGIKTEYEEEPEEPEKPRGRQPRDLTDIINRNDISLEKKYEESITKLQNDEYVKRRKALIDSAKTEARELNELYRKNENYIANPENKYKPLTEEQKNQIQQQQQWIRDTIINSQKKLNFDLSQLEKERQINSLIIMRETLDWQIDDIENSIEKEKSIKLSQLKDEEKLIKEQNKLAKDGGRNEAEITAEYAKKRLQIIANYDNQILALKKADIAAQLEVVKKGSEEELALLLKQNEIERQIALSSNRANPAAKQQSETQINQSFDKKATVIKSNFQMTSFDQQQALDEAIFNEVKHNETEITRFKLEQEKARWKKQIRLAEAGGLNWSQAQIDAAKASVKGIDRQLADLDNFLNNLGKKGLGGALLEKLGFDDDQISALSDAANIVIEQFQAIIDAEVELAEQAVEAANKRVEAAKNAYDAEVEARNNGYANNVATAKKELEQEKKRQQEKQKILEAAKKRQEALNTVLQASSLITASANLWSSFSSIPIVGPALALAAIATMWTSFAVAKVKAKQVTAGSDEYGEGGLEFLEGGSHASGNDIDLHTKNKRKRNMRAEGGEALAIINKRQTKRYKRALPDIIDSLNKGTFEDKYLRAFNSAEGLSLSFSSSKSDIDLSKLEKDVSDIRKQNKTKYYTLQNGDTIIISGNVKRIIKH